MKSIKEKAEEYSFIKQGIGPSGIQYRDFSINKKDAFMAGANYVLEQIEDVLINPRRYVNPDKSVEEGMVDALIKCVEQLKNNQ